MTVTCRVDPPNAIVMRSHARSYMGQTGAGGTEMLGKLRQWGLGVALATAVPGAVTAQDVPGELRGTVVSQSSGLPVPGALVLLDSGHRVIADGDGRFVFEDILVGAYRIAGVAPGCYEGVGEVEVTRGAPTVISLSLPLPPEAEDILGGWRATRASGVGVKVINQLEIRRRRLQSVQEALRVLAPEMVGLESAQAGTRGAIHSRRAATVAGPTAPLIVVDGVRVLHNPEDALDGINIDQVDEIRISKGTAGGWRYGLQGVNGVISVTTSTGVANALALGPRPEECGFRFPEEGPGAPPDDHLGTPAGGGS